MSRLRLWPGYNNGLIGEILTDEDGNVFDLTGATSIAMEIYDDANDVLATIAGTIDDATAGEYTIKPGADSLSALTENYEYYYRIKVVSPTYAQGRLFDVDSDGRLLKCVIGVG
jgi:hypothetical protein